MQLYFGTGPATQILTVGISILAVNAASRFLAFPLAAFTGVIASCYKVKSVAAASLANLAGITLSIASPGGLGAIMAVEMMPFIAGAMAATKTSPRNRLRAGVAVSSLVFASTWINGGSGLLAIASSTLSVLGAYLTGGYMGTSRRKTHSETHEHPKET